MGMRDCEVGWVGVRFCRKREREREREREDVKKGFLEFYLCFVCRDSLKGKFVFFGFWERESESEVFTEFNHFCLLCGGDWLFVY